MKNLSLKETLLSFLFFISFLYVTIFLPVSFSAYNPGWYRFVCNFHDRCERIGIDNSHEGIKELTGYFMHRNGLDDPRWTFKESLHLEEVREMFDLVVKIFLVIFLTFLLTFSKKRLRYFSIVNFFIVISLIAILPFFKTFWREVFHPLLFDNNLWINNRFDFSYWIMPRKFFMITVGFIIFSSALLNLMTFFVCRNFEKRNSRG